MHFIEGEAEGDVRVEVNDDGLDAVRRDVERRTGDARPPKISRSFVLEEDSGKHVKFEVARLADFLNQYRDFRRRQNCATQIPRVDSHNETWRYERSLTFF